ncbi:MAG: 2-oxoacid:ferredoxin oxidoreductase subunit beta [candidate division WOR-3 bacterium]|nr:MAG: 2-oxoacid:ferredoxin oxidoreductase subunit beta [candidate division WOR-3 bacterium]
MNPIINILDKGIEQSGVDRKTISIPSDIPFPPDAVKTLRIDYFQTPRGRAIAFGTGLKLGNPALKVIPIVGDLMTLGGNHFVHGARRNMEILVLCINNFVYKKIAGKPLTSANPEFSAYSTFEEPFNFPHLGNSCGAVYTARWTALHTKELATSVAEALSKRGLSMIEILAPGPNYYRTIDGVNSDILQFYFDNSIIKNNEDPRNVAITPEEKIVVGTFTDRERPTFIDSYNLQHKKILGDKFTPHGAAPTERGGKDG